MTEELKLSISYKLGGPLRQIELMDMHYEEAYKDAQETFFLYQSLYNLEVDEDSDLKEIWIKKYTLANCKEYLGRIRGKFGGVVGEGGTTIMDYKTLLGESSEERAELKYLISK